MPCANNIGSIYIKLSREDRVLDFALTKFNCRRPPGGLNIKNYIINKLINDILEGSAEDFITGLERFSPPVSGLLRIQFSSMKSALAVYCGYNTPATKYFTLKGIEKDSSATAIYGYISLDTTWENILGCGRCRDLPVGRRPKL